LTSRGERFIFVDALRGVAATLVLLHHLLHNTVLEVTLRTILPTPVIRLSNYGATGVQIFFVISGFVIAHSTRHLRGTLRDTGAFILRRQLRLDPPYWVALGLTLILVAVRHLSGGLRHDALPGIGTVLANMAYLQRILRLQEIVQVAWTLCLEVQFYLVLILLVALASRLNPHRTRWLSGAVLLLGLVSVPFERRGGFHGSPWFVAEWFYFAAGAVCYWVVRREAPAPFLWLLIAAMAWPMLLWDPAPVGVGMATVLSLYVVGRSGGLTSFARWRWIQYMGRISYSLYLVHLPVVTLVLPMGYKLTHTNRLAAVGWWAFGAALSVGVAELFYRFVERPSMRFASRFKPAIASPPDLVSIGNG